MGFLDFTRKIAQGPTSWFSGDSIKDAFSSKEIKPEAIQEPDFYTKLREQVGNRYNDLVSSGPEQYGGKYAAPLTDLENKSLQKVGEYGSMQAPALYGEGAREISKTLANEYDPATSQAFQAFRDQRLYDNEQAKSRFNEDAAGAGRFFHGGRIEGTRKLDEQATRDINTQNASLASQERDRQLSVLPQALNYGNAQAQFPLQQAAALQGYGGLQRTAVENPELAGMYGEYQRQIGQGRTDLASAGSFAGNPTYAYPQYEQPMILQYLNSIAGAAEGIGSLASLGGKPKLKA